MTAAALRARVGVGHPGGFRLDARITAPPGGTVAVMGPSGAGKSTLLAALAGLLPIDDGEILLDADVLSSPAVHVAAARRGTVLLGQAPLLFPHLSVVENVAFGPRAGGMRAHDARDLAEGWLARVGLADAGARRPDELSGGQQQRVAVARALAASPRLVLLDEPFTSLDPVTAADLRAMLSPQLASRTCVVVTHDAADAAALADAVVVVEAGRVTQSGPIREVLAAPATDFVAAVAGLDRVVGVADDAGRCVAGGVAFAGLHGAAEPAAAVAAVFRPGDVALLVDDRPATGGTRWTARIERIDGTVLGLRVRTAPPVVAVDVAFAAGAHLRIGDEVVLEVRPDAVRILSL